jgi:hypothetical protein
MPGMTPWGRVLSFLRGKQASEISGCFSLFFAEPRWMNGPGGLSLALELIISSCIVFAGCPSVHLLDGVGEAPRI